MGAILLIVAIAAVCGCSDEPKQADSKSQAEQQAEAAFLDRLGEPGRPSGYTGPAPQWWWLDPDHPRNPAAPEPGWWKRAQPPLCELVPEPEPEPVQPEVPEPPAVKPEKPRPKVAAKAPRPKRPKISAKPKSRKEAQREFEAFAEDFVDKMARNLRHSATNKQVVKNGSGYRASFIHLEKDTVTVEVKPCEGPAAYVGLMRYLEGHYENECATEECAVQGPFKLVKKVRTTEIFRYAGGRWQ